MPNRIKALPVSLVVAPALLLGQPKKTASASLQDLHTAGFNAWDHDYHQGVIDAYTAILLIAPDKTAYYRRGHAYLKLGKFEEAIRDYDALIPLDLDNAKAFNNRAFAHQALGHQKQFEADAREAYRLESEPYSVKLAKATQAADTKRATEAALLPWMEDDALAIADEGCLVDVIKLMESRDTGLAHRKRLAELMQFGCLKMVAGHGRVECRRNVSGRFAEVKLIDGSLSWGPLSECADCPAQQAVSWQ